MKAASTTRKGRFLNSYRNDNLCQDFLCPPETYICEWFPSFLQGRLRAKALDPYGMMKQKVQEDFLYYYTCQDETCHAKLALRKVDPDPEGNTFGLYGCFAHQHPLPRQNKSEIVFKNKSEAEEYFDKNFKLMYKSSGIKKDDYSYFRCRRPTLTYLIKEQT